MNEADRKLAEMAVEAASRSVKESRDDGAPPPLVGAVIVTEAGEVLSAFRGERVSDYEGEQGDGDHAEFSLLHKKLGQRSLAGATLFTTLEPCIRRGEGKVACATRTIGRKIKRVFIGMLDPNQSIRGNGILQLRAAGIEVQLFPSDLMCRVEEQNREFYRYHIKRGLPAANESWLPEVVRFSGLAALSFKSFQKLAEQGMKEAALAARQSASAIDGIKALRPAGGDEEGWRRLCEEAEELKRQRAEGVEARAAVVLESAKTTEVQYEKARKTFLTTLEMLSEEDQAAYLELRAAITSL